MRADLVTESALIEIYIGAVASKAESYLKGSVVTQTLELVLDGFNCKKIKLPMGPVQSITSIKYLDCNGDEQTVDSSVYRLTASNEVILAYGKSWPDYRSDVDSVKIRYVAGYGDADLVPSAIKAWIMMNVATLYENRETVTVGNGGVIELDTIADGLIDYMVNW